jgi:hypothetical protein
MVGKKKNTRDIAERRELRQLKLKKEDILQARQFHQLKLKNQIILIKKFVGPISHLPPEVYSEIISYLSHPSNFVRSSRAIMNTWKDIHVKSKWFIQNAQSESKFQLEPAYIVQHGISLPPVIIYWIKYLTEPVANIIARVLVNSKVSLFGERKDHSRFNMKSEAMHFASRGFLEAVKIMMEPGLKKMAPPRVIEIALIAEEEYYSDEDDDGCDCPECNQYDDTEDYSEMYSGDEYYSSEESGCGCPDCAGFGDEVSEDGSSEDESGCGCSGGLLNDNGLVGGGMLGLEPVLNANVLNVATAKQGQLVESGDEMHTLEPISPTNPSQATDTAGQLSVDIDKRINAFETDEITVPDNQEVVESDDEMPRLEPITIYNTTQSEVDEIHGLCSDADDISDSDVDSMPDSSNTLAVNSDSEIPPLEAVSRVNTDAKKMNVSNVDNLDPIGSRDTKIDHLSDHEDESDCGVCNCLTCTAIIGINEDTGCQCSFCKNVGIDSDSLESHDFDECNYSDCEECAEYFADDSDDEHSVQSDCMCEICVAQRFWDENQMMEEEDMDEEFSDEEFNVFGLVEETSEDDSEIDRYWGHPWEVLNSAMEHYNHEKHYKLLVWIKETFDKRILKTNRSPSDFEPFENESLYTHILQREKISNILIVVKLLVEMNARPTRQELMFLTAEAIASSMGVGRSKGLLELFPKDWILQQLE